MNTENKYQYPKLHNATWPGLVGKGGPDSEPVIEFETMLDLTAATEVDGVRFDGVDIFLSLPHTDIDSTDDDLKRLADSVQDARPGYRFAGSACLGTNWWRFGDGFCRGAQGLPYTGCESLQCREETS